MARHNELGRLGEQIAAEYLIKKGYTIRDSNWRWQRYELDIVCEHNGRIVIVEVKTRTSGFIKINHIEDAFYAPAKTYR